MDDEIKIKASKANRKKKTKKIAKMVLLISTLLLLMFYIVISIVYNSGNFSITLDKNLYMKRNIIIYDDLEYKIYRSELHAESMDYLDNISYKWFPEDLDKSLGGSHNGENYVAYTFYIENMGEETSDYYSEIIIDDVIKNVDEAIRIRVYKDGEYETYAKIAHNGNPEKLTTPFESKELVALKHVENFKPGDIHKYTIVIWLEGTDPECTDNILGILKLIAVDSIASTNISAPIIIIIIPRNNKASSIILLSFI